MKKSGNDDQLPLLVFIVEDEKNVKNKRRFQGIANGATTLMTEWPNYINSCWVTTIVSSITLVILTLLLLAAMSNSTIFRLPRCIRSYEDFDNKTVHLVHGPEKWAPNELGMLEKIIQTFENYKIHVIAITDYENVAVRVSEIDLMERNKNESRLTSIKKFFYALFQIQSNATDAVVPTFNELLQKYPQIILTNSSYYEIYKKSPLYCTWPQLGGKLKIFAIRVLQLWQYGGLSFDLQQMMFNTNFLINEPKNYENLTIRIASVDEDAIHMETKSPCHAFFGEILTSLRTRRHLDDNPRSILKTLLKIYCKNRAIQEQYCDEFTDSN